MLISIEKWFNAEKKTQEEANCILVALRTVEKTCFLLALLYGSAIGLFLMSPAYTFIFRNEASLPFAIHAPYVDAKTAGGYIFTFCTQLVFLIYALIGITGYDCGFLVYLYLFKAFSGKKGYEKFGVTFMLSLLIKNITSYIL